MKKKVLLLIALLLPVMVSAQICVDGIYYDRTDDGNYKVIKNPNGYDEEVTIPSFVNGIKVTEIDHQAFENTTVTAVHLPITIEKIGVGAFSMCNNIYSIEIPENVNWIDAYAFGGNPNLCNIYCYAKNITLNIDIFYRTKVKNITLHVPEVNIDYFKKADQWKKIKKIVPTTTKSWAVEQHEKDMIEQKRKAEEQERMKAEAREKQIRDSIAAREKQIKDSIEAKEKLVADIAAADQGDSEAQLRMGYRYWNGDGVEKSVNQAIAYFKKAADKGNVDAQLELGEIYYDGEGVNKDEKTAKIWLEKAAAQGNERAKKILQQYIIGRDSYWISRSNWKMVFPNGLIVNPDTGKGAIETNNFIVYVIRGDEAYLDNDDFIKIMSRKKKFEEGTVIEVKTSNLSYYRSLTDNQKNELIKKELSVFSFSDGTQVFTYYQHALSGSNELDGTIVKGKFVSKGNRLATLTKRFGFDPTSVSPRRIIVPGRSIDLINEYADYCDENQEKFYRFKLASDDGATKVYRLYWGYGTKVVGGMWVRGGKVTSVKWLK